MGSQTLVFHQREDSWGSENRTSASRGNGFFSFGTDPQLVIPESPLAGAWIFRAQERASFHGGHTAVLRLGLRRQLRACGPHFSLRRSELCQNVEPGTRQTPGVRGVSLSLSDVLTPFNVTVCFSHPAVGQQSKDRSFSLAGGREGEEVGSSGVLSQVAQAEGPYPTFLSPLTPPCCPSAPQS